MVSQSLLALALLASAAALPMMPFSKGLMGYGGMMGMPMGNPHAGSSYKTGSSYTNGNGEITTIPSGNELLLLVFFSVFVMTLALFLSLGLCLCPSV